MLVVVRADRDETGLWLGAATGVGVGTCQALG
jgi:hypothetical protein